MSGRENQGCGSMKGIQAETPTPLAYTEGDERGKKWRKVVALLRLQARTMVLIGCERELFIKKMEERPARCSREHQGCLLVFKGSDSSHHFGFSREMASTRSTGVGLLYRAVGVGLPYRAQRQRCSPTRSKCRGLSPRGFSCQALRSDGAYLAGSGTCLEPIVPFCFLTSPLWNRNVRPKPVPLL